MSSAQCFLNKIAVLGVPCDCNITLAIWLLLLFLLLFGYHICSSGDVALRGLATDGSRVQFPACALSHNIGQLSLATLRGR